MWTIQYIWQNNGSCSQFTQLNPYLMHLLSSLKKIHRKFVLFDHIMSLKLHSIKMECLWCCKVQSVNRLTVYWFVVIMKTDYGVHFAFFGYGNVSNSCWILIHLYSHNHKYSNNGNLMSCENELKTKGVNMSLGVWGCCTEYCRLSTLQKLWEPPSHLCHSGLHHGVAPCQRSNWIIWANVSKQSIMKQNALQNHVNFVWEIL